MTRNDHPWDWNLSRPKDPEISHPNRSIGQSDGCWDGTAVVGLLRVSQAGQY